MAHMAKRAVVTMNLYFRTTTAFLQLRVYSQTGLIGQKNETPNKVDIKIINGQGVF